MNIVELYLALRADPRLQKNWELNQPRVDRALEAPLIARTPREVATAALLAVKLKFEPSAGSFRESEAVPELLSFARTQGSGGSRLANILERRTPADESARTASSHALRFYQDRTASNPLVRLPWSAAGLDAIAGAKPNDIINPALKPTWAQRKGLATIELARLLRDPDTRLLDDQALRGRLRSIPGIGPERADAIAVFGFGRGLPICDDYLWRLLRAHGIISAETSILSSYDARTKAFAPHWEELLNAKLDEPGQLAATLYLWADEAARFGFRYDNAA